MEKARICISSPPDREKLVAEIFFGREEWAEINQEGDVLMVEFYTKENGEFWQVSFDDAVQTLQAAKLRLVGEG